jgi:hypothetical protein
VKATTYPAIGGPLDGHRVTEQYAGPDYHRYNTAVRLNLRYSAKKCAACRKGILRVQTPGGKWLHQTGMDKPGQIITGFECNIQHPDKPKGVLVHKSIWEGK